MYFNHLKKTLSMNKAGFTVMELVVSIGVIAVLSALFLVGYRSAGQDSDLRMSAGQLMNSIRVAQSRTLGAVAYEGDVPEGGWGIHLDEDRGTYIIYADVNENFSYDGESEKWQARELPDDTHISSIDVSSSVDIVFEPPDPITYINGDDMSKVDIVISDDRGESKTVRVNFFGLIEVAE